MGAGSAAGPGPGMEAVGTPPTVAKGLACPAAPTHFKQPGPEVFIYQHVQAQQLQRQQSTIAAVLCGSGGRKQAAGLHACILQLLQLPWVLLGTELTSKHVRPSSSALVAQSYCGQQRGGGRGRRGTLLPRMHRTLKLASTTWLLQARLESCTQC